MTAEGDNSAKKNEIAELNKNIENEMASLGNELKAAEAMYISLTSESDFLQLKNLKSFDDPVAIDKLKKFQLRFSEYSSALPIKDGILLMFTKSNTLLTSNSIITNADKFYGKLWSFGDISYDDAVNILTNNTHIGTFVVILPYKYTPENMTSDLIYSKTFGSSTSKSKSTDRS